jgi:hypothetical protein
MPDIGYLLREYHKPDILETRNDLAVAFDPDQGASQVFTGTALPLPGTQDALVRTAAGIQWGGPAEQVSTKF